jgi:hypothetical protein
MLPELYAIDDSGGISRLERCPSGVGEEDLRRLIERNPGLLPGSRGGDSEGWLLVGRNMPPAALDDGVGWSVDYLFVDRDGMPTFVDCKCPFQTGTRHEVIGRMLEYVATAQTSWEEKDLRSWLSSEHYDPDAAVASLLGDSPPDSEAFIDGVLKQLKLGRFRLVFLVGEATSRLLRVVEFLNQQMERAEFYVIEAGQYRAEGVRILAPVVFGPDLPDVEPAPVVAAVMAEDEPIASEVESAAVVFEMEEPAFAGFETESEEVGDFDAEDLDLDHRAENVDPVFDTLVNETSFFEDVETRLAGDHVRAVRTFYEVAQRLAYNLQWSNGGEGVSLGIALARLAEEPLMSVRADGTLTLNFGALEGDSVPESQKQRFRSIAHNRLDLVCHLDEMRASMRPHDWCPKVTGVLRVLDDLASMAGQASPPSAH